MELNRPATMANLIEAQTILIRSSLDFSAKQVIELENLEACMLAIRAGYPDSQVLEALQFVGPGIAVQS